MSESILDGTDDLPGTVDRPARSRFYVDMSLLLLAVVLAGFAATFYLRPQLLWVLPPDFRGISQYGPVLPTHLYVHGFVLTAWFLFAVIQPCLVAVGRTDSHRRLGIVGVILAVAVVAVSVMSVVLRDAPVIDEFPRRGAGNLIPLTGFSICLVSAILLRRRPEADKRLMLFASFALAGPAIERIGRLPPFLEFFSRWFPDRPSLLFAMIATLGIVTVIIAYDLVSQRRVHGATIWALCAKFPIAFAVSGALAFSGLWTAFVRVVS